ILEKLHNSLKLHVEVLAASPAQVIIQYEDTSSTLLSPAVFDRYCLPFLNEYADILNSSDKIYLVHMCGKLRSFTSELHKGRFNGICDITPMPTGDFPKLRSFTSELHKGRFNGICDITPMPTGDFPLDEASANLPGKVVVGGIDPTTFVSRDAECVEAEVAGLIQRIKPLKGVLLGSADTVPRGTPVSTFKLIRGLVDALGAYRERIQFWPFL
ncbi:MAG: hypothetical protein JRF41_15125, partial [Deltaproteobacteria bacterium]|nr:hypothetical protein [Deltaproteobacteria bacterium]